MIFQITVEKFIGIEVRRIAGKKAEFNYRSVLLWPGRVEPKTENAAPICGVDLLPTLCEIASIGQTDDRVLDGASFLPVFENKPITRNTPLYWHFLRAKGAPKAAIRIGDWKMTAEMDGEPLKPAGGITEEEVTFNKTVELTGFQLFNLTNDIAESTDLSEKEPARFEEMKSTLIQKYHEVRAESPVWPAWEWPRYEAHRIEWPEYKAMRKPPVYK